MIDIRDSLDMAMTAYYKMQDATTSPTREKRRCEFVLHASNVITFLMKSVEEVAWQQATESMAVKRAVWNLMLDAHKRGDDLESAHYRAEYDRLTNELKATGEV